MKWYLVVYEQPWRFEIDYTEGLMSDVAMSSGDYGQTHWYSRLRSLTVQATNKIDAFNKATDKLNSKDCNIVHIEALD